MKNNKRHGKKGPNQIFHYSPVEDTTLLNFLYLVLAPRARATSSRCSRITTWPSTDSP